MGKNRQFDHIGEDLQNAWNKSWETMDFSILSRAINHSVNDAIDGVRDSVGDAIKDVRGSVNDAFRDVRGSARDAFGDVKDSFRDAMGTDTAAGRNSAKADARREWYRTLSEAKKEEILAALKLRETTTLPDTLVNKRPAGGAKGVLMTVFGALSGASFGAGSVIAIIAAIAGGLGLAGTAAIAGLLLGLTAAGTIVCCKGIERIKLLNRFRRYVSALNNRKYAEVRKLAAVVGRSEDFVVRDLREMSVTDLFPQGRVSEDKKYFLLDETTAGHYQQLLDKQKQEQAEEAARLAKENEPQRKALREAVETGRSYIRQIREANDQIPGEEITKKLDFLEEGTERIFTHLETRPELLPQLRMFMEYYLPMTMKLVNAYREFDAQPIQGENITKAKQEIEASLDTINEAFVRLYDDLFADSAMDVFTDISVLQTLLAQEGLVRDEIRETETV